MRKSSQALARIPVPLGCTLWTSLVCPELRLADSRARSHAASLFAEKDLSRGQQREQIMGSGKCIESSRVEDPVRRNLRPQQLILPPIDVLPVEPVSDGRQT